MAAASRGVVETQLGTYEKGELALFESGAIVFHIAERGFSAGDLMMITCCSD
jgi:hypothetical protein